MNVIVELQNASSIKQIPLRRQFKQWADAAMNMINSESTSANLSIRIVDEAESAALNSQYRDKQGATNILSFPLPAHMPLTDILGDLAICAPVVLSEAQLQHKQTESHWAHLVIHGVLHLVGYDHENNTDAAEMETLEIKILKQLGIDNPYQPH